ncbi:MAG: putative peptidoglycan lipid II flippase [Alteromonadaceae bacterium]
MNKLIGLLERYKHYLVVFGFTIASHGLGFGREVSIAYLFGTSSVSDGLLVGLAPLNLYIMVIGLGYANAAIARIKSPDNSRLINLSFYPIPVMAIIIACVFFFFNETIIAITAPGLKGEGVILARQIVLASALGAGVASVYFWSRSIRHLNKQFLRVSMSELLPNLGILLGIFVLYRFIGVTGIAVGITLGYVLQLGFVFEPGRVNWRGFTLAALFDKDIKLIYKNTMLSALGVSGLIVDLFVDRYFASQLAEGSIAAINFAHKVMTLPLFTLVLAVVTVMFPRLIGLRDDMAGFNRLKVKTNWLLVGFCLLNSLIFIYFSHGIISLLFNYGQFDAADVAATAPLLSIYAAGLTAHALVLYNAKVRYALEDFKTPLYAGACAALVNLVLDFLLVDTYGTAGLASATSIAACVNAAILITRKQPENHSGSVVEAEAL